MRVFALLLAARVAAPPPGMAFDPSGQMPIREGGFEVEVGVARLCEHGFDGRFEKRGDCPTIEVPGRLRVVPNASSCAALCSETPNCKSWSWRHYENTRQYGVLDVGRRLASRPARRAPMRRHDPTSSSRPPRRNQTSESKIPLPSMPQGTCRLFSFAMRGTHSSGWSSGDIDRPVQVIENGTIFGGRVCSCGRAQVASALQRRL